MGNSTRGEGDDVWAALSSINEANHNNVNSIVELCSAVNRLVDVCRYQGERIQRLEDRVNFLERNAGPPNRADGL